MTSLDRAMKVSGAFMTSTNQHRKLIRLHQKNVVERRWSSHRWQFLCTSMLPATVLKVLQQLVCCLGQSKPFNPQWIPDRQPVPWVTKSGFIIKSTTQWTMKECSLRIEQSKKNMSVCTIGITWCRESNDLGRFQVHQRRPASGDAVRMLGAWVCLIFCRQHGCLMAHLTLQFRFYHILTGAEQGMREWSIITRNNHPIPPFLSIPY